MEKGRHLSTPPPYVGLSDISSRMDRSWLCAPVRESCDARVAGAHIVLDRKNAVTIGHGSGDTAGTLAIYENIRLHNELLSP